MVRNNMVVSLAYTLKNSEGEEIERAREDSPLQYLHGRGHLVAGLEKSIEGLLVGSKKDIVIPPEEGYGAFDPKLKIKTDISMFPKDVKVKIGMQFTADLGDGKNQNFKVEKIEGNEVFINGNHPLASKTLQYSIEVLDIREATQEELQHGHAHGPGGHNH